MRVLLTGGAGLIGRSTASHLQSHGWDVHLIDVVPEADVNAHQYKCCDIMDFDQLLDHMQGIDMVVHLAALKNPFIGPTHEVFRVNTAGTFNVFEAAAQVGIRRVVQASSINAIGCGWNLGDFLPQYLPMDEDHPSVTTDSYAFSKRMVEDIGAFYWRRDGISSVALRFPGVFAADYRDSQRYAQWHTDMLDFIESFRQLPAAERQRQLAAVHAKTIEYRASRSMEYPETGSKKIDLEGINEHLWRIYTFDRYYLWTALDERDAAQSIEKSLTADFEGSHVLFINDRYTSLNYESRVLVDLFFPHMTTWKRPLVGAETLVSIERAQALIGFEPEYSLHGASNS